MSNYMQADCMLYYVAVIYSSKEPKWGFSRGFKFPGSRGFIPGKREAKIRKFPWKSLPRNSREETLCSCDGSHLFVLTCHLFSTGQKCGTWHVPKRSGIQYWSEVWNLICSQKVGYSVLVRSLKPDMFPKCRLFRTVAYSVLNSITKLFGN